VDEVIDDLLRKTPENEYLDEDLFDLQLHCYSDVREYMRRRFYGSVSDWNLGTRRGGLTRRSRKVWDKLEAAVNRVRTAGSEGVYLVYDGWRTKIGYLFAKSSDEARTLAKALYGYLMTSETTRVRVEFVRHGNEKDMSEMNSRVIEAYNAKMRANKKRIEEMRQENTEIRTRIKSISMVSSQQQDLTGSKKR
jgi:hypothetical protein